ncbi:hypothetical protein GCM10007989_00340 [Devosia pacifica]|uniref:Uncharacterized protein n=1 Tax=Devosia pacifica TaxID=1335967 RepID=A0A918RU70_9HYPH|nr:hypothetical protein GCM10007989_00340 [Devosia pacifica]
MWPFGQLHRDKATGKNDATLFHYSHNARLAYKRAVRIPVENRGEKALAEGLNLLAGIPQTSDAQHNRVTNLQQRVCRQPQQIEACRRDVLAQCTGRNIWIDRPKFVQQLGVYEVDLTQVRLRRVHRYPGAMLDGRSEVRIAKHTMARDQFNPV